MQFILAIVLALREFHSGVASLHCHSLEEFLSMQGLLPGTVHVKKSLNFLHAHLVYIFFLLHAVRPLRHRPSIFNVVPHRDFGLLLRLLLASIL